MGVEPNASERHKGLSGEKGGRGWDPIVIAASAFVVRVVPFSSSVRRCVNLPLAGL